MSTDESDEQSLEATPSEPSSQAETLAESTPALAAETEAVSTELERETAVPSITEQLPQEDAAAETTNNETISSLATETDDPLMAAPSDAVPIPKKPSTRKRRGQPAVASHKSQPTLRQVTTRFAACGRCSYFWAGYKVIQGEAALATAVAQSQSGWLNLEWNSQMPELVYKSYGVRFDITHFHYEGCCKECRRPFIYQAADSEEEADSFQIAITPRVSP